MIVFDFIYFSIYSFVPDKAIFGKRDVACTFFACFTAMILLGLFATCEIAFNFRINSVAITIVLFGGLIILTRNIFLKPAKLRCMHRRFRKIPKLVLKTIGILYLVFCFVMFAILLTRVSNIVSSG